MFRKLPELRKTLADLERRLAELEGRLHPRADGTLRPGSSPRAADPASRMPASRIRLPRVIIEIP